MTLRGKIAVITGGNSGIGESVAYALAREGADVIIAGRRKKDNERVVARIQKDFNRKSIGIRTDVTKESDCEHLIHQALAQLGRVDILVNSAGIYAGGRIVETTCEEFDNVLKTNLYGTFWCSRSAFKIMQKMGGGYIITLSSIAGKEAWSETGPYSASKFAVMALTAAMADEGKAYNIKCTAICPALVATPMTGMSGPEYLQPEDVAETVLYLLRLSAAVWPVEVVLPRKGAA